jgi:hypothetical protein
MATYTRLAIALATLSLTACEHGTDVDGTVVAPIEVQQLFSAEHPGQLFVVATLPTGGKPTDSRAVFCIPSPQERRIDIKASTLECAQAGVAHVSAYAVPRDPSRIDCATAAVIPAEHAYGPDTFDPEGAVASGSADVPVTASGGGCQDGAATFTITLAPR